MVYLDNFIPIFVNSGGQAQIAVVVSRAARHNYEIRTKWDTINFDTKSMAVGFYTDLVQNYLNIVKMLFRQL